ncbi:hypothetical protein E2C01_013552 [Portunus trituberculatus]|uniref:Uncharacterized protein n=1 Tax=Portunus trituberculatus TaxID=210409 RepID=A0A5B7DHL1_PORTR|nr:hypothetical protein [Portunus trituberculatus]
MYVPPDTRHKNNPQTCTASSSSSSSSCAGFSLTVGVWVSTVSWGGFGPSFPTGTFLGPARVGGGALPFASLPPFLPALAFLFSLLLPADWGNTTSCPSTPSSSCPPDCPEVWETVDTVLVRISFPSSLIFLSLDDSSSSSSSPSSSINDISFWASASSTRSSSWVRTFLSPACLMKEDAAPVAECHDASLVQGLGRRLPATRVLDHHAGCPVHVSVDIYIPLPQMPLHQQLILLAIPSCQHWTQNSLRPANALVPH